MWWRYGRFRGQLYCVCLQKIMAGLLTEYPHQCILLSIGEFRSALRESKFCSSIQRYSNVFRWPQTEGHGGRLSGSIPGQQQIQANSRGLQVHHGTIDEVSYRLPVLFIELLSVWRTRKSIQAKWIWMRISAISRDTFSAMFRLLSRTRMRWMCQTKSRFQCSLSTWSIRSRASTSPLWW